MPQWIHDRARHIQAKNPGMKESTSFAIATQQAHAVGKSPEGYGTPEGKREAKAKYDTPKDDKKTADPGGVGRELEEKAASIGKLLQPLYGEAHDERMRMIAREELAKMGPPPSSPKRKHAGTRELVLRGLLDELHQIKLANLSGTDGKPTTMGQIRSTLPRNTLTGAAKYSKVNTDTSPSPVAQHQPVLSPPPVRG